LEQVSVRLAQLRSDIIAIRASRTTRSRTTLVNGAVLILAIVVRPWAWAWVSATAEALAAKTAPSRVTPTLAPQDNTDSTLTVLDLDSGPPHPTTPRTSSATRSSPPEALVWDVALVECLPRVGRTPRW
jgi:hypothetical protein